MQGAHHFRKRRLLVATGACAGAAAGACFLFAPARHDVVQYLQSAAPMPLQVQGSWSTPGMPESTLLSLHDRWGSVAAALRFPPGPGPFPALIILGGLRTGRHAVDLAGGEHAIAVAALDWAGGGSRRLQGPSTLLQLPGLRRDLRRTAVALRDLARFVARDPRVDSTQVYVLGASLGTPLAAAVTAAAAPAGLVLLYGFADHAAAFEHRLRASVPWLLPRWLLAQLGASLTADFEARRTLPRACGTPVLVVSSPEDAALPRRCREALWTATCAPRQRVDLPGGHIDAGRDAAVLQQATSVILAWLDAVDTGGAPASEARRAASRRRGDL